MGILAPLYLAGLAALSLPLILHLVRRTPRGRQAFSSLMFLTPTPPRLTRRSRLDQVLLLLLRLAALGLLALAFCRPFFRESALLATSDLPQRRVAILVDTSASMRRADLWQQAQRQIERELDNLAPHDDVSLFAFTDRLHAIVDFDGGGSDSSRTQADAIRSRLKTLQPTWAASDLGAALVAIASELDAVGDAQQLPAELQVVLVSDFQQGSRIEALHGFEWPERVRVVARHVKPKRTSNAFAHLLAADDDAAQAEQRVRVANAADSTADQFFIRWASEAPTLRAGGGSIQSGETAIYVPPGQSRVVKLPRGAGVLQADRIVLRGDDHDFDNTHYVVPPLKLLVKLLYAGNDAADDPQGMQYYLRLASAGDPLRQVEVVALGDGHDAESVPPQLIVVTRQLAASLLAKVKSYVERGTMLVLAPSDRDAAQSLRAFFTDLTIGEEQPGGENDFLLLGEIDFTHPLFAPLSGPRYSDFTKIHFWRHRAIRALTGDQNEATRIIARFDNGDPAIFERSLGKGRLLVMASGWNPDDSQLALSTKFVPLVGGLLDMACGTPPVAAGLTVEQPITLAAQPSVPTVVHRPDGRLAKLGAETATFNQTDQPGIYRTVADGDERRFAVNLAATESNTAPLELDQLEQLGVRMGTDVTRAQRLGHMRQQRDTELESRQQAWRWLLVGTLGLLVIETWWAGRAARTADRVQTEAAKEIA